MKRLLISIILSSLMTSAAIAATNSKVAPFKRGWFQKYEGYHKQIDGKNYALELSISYQVGGPLNGAANGVDSIFSCARLDYPGQIELSLIDTDNDQLLAIVGLFMYDNKSGMEQLRLVNDRSTSDDCGDSGVTVKFLNSDLSSIKLLLSKEAAKWYMLPREISFKLIK